MVKNIFLVRQLAADKSCELRFKHNACRIYKDGQLLVDARLVQDLYELKVIKAPAPEVHTLRTLRLSNLEIVKLWHKRLGHPSMGKMKRILGSDMYLEKISGTGIQAWSCEPCILAKHHKSKFPKISQSRAVAPLQMVHSEICDPVSTTSLGGGRYFVNFIDDYSRFCWTYIMRNKSEAFTCFREFKALAENQSGRRVVTLRTDNGREFDSVQFQAYCTKEGIARYYTTPYSSAQNGIAERKNRTLQDAAWAMLKQSGLPRQYWAKAIAAATYLQNILPSKATANTTPYELWYNEKPTVTHLRVFGSVAYAHLDKHQLEHTKLSDRASH